MDNFKYDADLLSREDEYEIFTNLRKAEADGRKRTVDRYKTILTQKNMGLCGQIANRYRSRTDDFDNVMQGALEGLVMAINRFDKDVGVKFSTYSYYYIQQLSQEAYTGNKVIKVPSSLRREVPAVMAVITEYIDEHKVRPDVSYISSKTGLNVRDVEVILGASQYVGSLNEVISDGDDNKATEIIDTIADEKDQYANISATPLTQIIQDAKDGFAKLSERHIKIIWLLFDTNNGNRRTYGDIGEIMGLTHERVRQIFKDAVKKIFTPKDTYFTDKYLDIVTESAKKEKAAKAKAKAKAKKDT